MRFYSRGQVLIIAACVLVTALTVGIGIGNGWFAPHSDSPSLAVSAESPSLQNSAAASPVQTSTVEPEYSQDERENINVYEKYNDAVVNITTQVVAVNWFMEPVPQDGGSGSGSIIDARGYILTNNHVVKGAYKLFVNLSDGSRYEAQVVGVDPENDLAVIKFAPPKGLRLNTIPFGDSSKLKVGQKVLAIGNPFGLERTLTDGIVSGLGRPVKEDSTTIIRDMIQTDASINPGNSGGPLLNSRGEMVGINTMIYSPSGGSVGIGFSVPVNTAKRIVPELIKNGRVSRGWIDMDTVQLFPELVEYMKQNGYAVGTEKGLLVSQTKRGGNADRAGVKGGGTAVRYGRSTFYVGGDIIVSVDGMKVSSLADLYSALEDNKPGDRVMIEYYRGTKKTTVQVQLSDRAQASDAEQ